MEQVSHARFFECPVYIGEQCSTRLHCNYLYSSSSIPIFLLMEGVFIVKKLQFLSSILGSFHQIPREGAVTPGNAFEKNESRFGGSLSHLLRGGFSFLSFRNFIFFLAKYMDRGKGRVNISCS